jgi:hypothetical protein
MLLLGLTVGAELPIFISRAHLTLGHLTLRRRTYSTSKLLKSDPVLPLSQPFEELFGTPADTSAEITTASFEPFATRGLPVLLKANLVNEVLHLILSWVTT